MHISLVHTHSFTHVSAPIIKSKILQTAHRSLCLKWKQTNVMLSSSLYKPLSVRNFISFRGGKLRTLLTLLEIHCMLSLSGFQTDSLWKGNTRDPEEGRLHALAPASHALHPSSFHITVSLSACPLFGTLCSEVIPQFSDLNSATFNCPKPIKWAHGVVRSWQL